MKNILIILAGLVVIYSCETKSEQKEQDSESFKGSLKPTAVKVQKADIKPFEYLIHTTGKVQASKTVEIKFKTSGQITQFNSHNGKQVDKNEPLVKLDDERQQLALKKANANLEQKSFEYESQIMSFSLSKMDEEQARTIKKNIEHSSGLIQAKLDQEEAELQLSYTQIIAPFDGIIANQAVKVGNFVNQGDKLCDIYSPNKLEVISYVLEGDLSQIHMGDLAEIRAIENEVPSEAIISEINPQVNEKGLVQIVLEIKSKNNQLLPGMNTEVLIKVPKEKNIVVHKEAIVVRSGREVVFVVEDDRAKWHYVTTGLDNGKDVEILEGLEPDDAVIITNNLQLANDALVEVE